MSQETAAAPAFLPMVHAIANDRPWLWLQRGWQDLSRIPLISLTYGAGIVAAGYLLGWLLWQAQWTYLVLPLAGGFLLVAPFVAVGLYDASRRLERQEPVSLAIVLLSWRRPIHVAGFGLVLLLLHFAWMRTAMLWFVLYFHGGTPPLDQLPLYMLEPQNLPFLVIGSVIGVAFAIVTFAISAVSLPLLLDRDIDVVSAIIVSLRAVWRNPKAMALWAGLIALFTAVGLVTFFIGLGLLFPLVAHASWHAYRDLVD